MTQIIVPMAGAGDRFVRAGYSTLKPLIPVDGRPMLAHILGNFPGERNFLFICAEDHLTTSPLAQLLEQLAPGAPVVAIPPHKLGPVHTVLAAAEHIADDEPIILNYCDFGWDWDYADFQRHLAAHDPAGCVTAYRGFHPHSLGPNLYAYMREQDGRMLEIKEKGAFTSDRMNEFASAGTYYFRSGRLMKHYFRQAVERGLATNGEYYASTPFNLLVEDGLPVTIYELRHFLQWGTPEDLEEYQAWSDYFAHWAGWRPSLPLGPGSLLVPMAGDGARFVREGYHRPKPLISVAGIPMAQRALETLPAAQGGLAVCRQEHLDGTELAALLRETTPALRVLPLAAPTQGQASTCLLARGHVPDDAPLLIAPCDTALAYDESAFAALAADPRVDCVVWAFRNHPHANRNPAQYGWVQADADGWIADVSVKAALGGDVHSQAGIIGAFWFRRARDFFGAAEALIAQDQRVNGEFYVDSVIGVLLAHGRRARVFDVRHYICLGTPDDVRTFEYWQRYFSRAPGHPYSSRAAHD